MSSIPRTHKDVMLAHSLRGRPAHVWGAWPAVDMADAAQPGGVQRAADMANGVPPGGVQRSVVRTIVVDGHAKACRDLRWELRLEPDHEVVGEADTAAAGIALAQDQRPDIVVMDVEMPVVDGVQAAERLHSLAPDCLVMLLTVHDSMETHERGRAAGARVVMEKGNPGLFRNTFHDLVQFVKARNTPAWPEIIVPDVP